MKWCYYPHFTNAERGTGSQAHCKVTALSYWVVQSCFSFHFEMHMSNIQTPGFLFFLLKDKHEKGNSMGLIWFSALK